MDEVTQHGLQLLSVSSITVEDHTLTAAFATATQVESGAVSFLPYLVDGELSLNRKVYSARRSFDDVPVSPLGRTMLADVETLVHLPLSAEELDPLGALAGG